MSWGSNITLRAVFWAVPALMATVAVAATPADTVRARIASYRALGAAFKNANDTIRAGRVRTPAIRAAATQIAGAARSQYGWYPAGSGAQARVKTAAKPEIWTRAREFRAAQDTFARQATAFERVVATGDEAAIRASVRQLGASCKGCHDSFRASDD
jgi:cytochrome c556